MGPIEWLPSPLGFSRCSRLTLRCRRWSAARQSSGYLLREAREAAGFTQGRLAARLGRTQQAIAQAERFISNPTMEFVREWARALGQNAVLEFTGDDAGATVGAIPPE